MYLNKPRGFKETLSSKGHSSKNDIIQASFLNADGDISEKTVHSFKHKSRLSGKTCMGR